MKQSLVLLCTLGLLLSACSIPQAPSSDASDESDQNSVSSISSESSVYSSKEQEVMKDDMNDSMNDEMHDHGGWVDQADDPGEYTAYFDGVIGNGLESVLFFHASWCPHCIANDKRLTEWYSANEFPRSIYKIDYDSSAELKQMFGVVQQDTFVLIDGNGNEVRRVSFPSEAALKGLLGA